MTLVQTRIRAGHYRSVHQETGRTFEVINPPTTYDWYALEHLPGEKFSKPIKFQDVDAKKRFLEKLELYISDPEALKPKQRPIPKPQAPARRPVVEQPPTPFPSAIVVLKVSVKRIDGGYFYTIGTHQYRVFSSDNVTWDAIDLADGVQVCFGLPNRQILEQELLFLSDPIDRLPAEGETGVLHYAARQQKATYTIRSSSGKTHESVAEGVQGVHFDRLKAMGVQIQS